MELFANSALLSGLVAMLYGIYVFIKAHYKTAKEYLYLLLSLSTGLWALNYWFWMKQTDPQQALFFVKYLSVFAAMSVPFFVHWVYLTFNWKDWFYKYILIPYSYITSLLVAIFFIVAPQIFVWALKQNDIVTFWPLGTHLYLVSIILSFVLPVVSVLIYLIYYFLFSKDSNLKTKYLIIIIGAILGFGGAATNFFLWYDIKIYPYGNFVMVLFPVLFAYASFKYKLFNIKAIVVDTTVFFLIVSSFFKLIVSSNKIDFVWNIIFFVIVITVSFILVRTFESEEKNKAQIETLVKRLRKANEHLRELNRKKTEFLSIATHQLRAPVTIMKGQLSLILEGDYGKLPDYLKEPLRKIYDSAERLSITITDFLNVSRIEQGKMKYNFSEIKISDLLQSIYDELKSLADKKGLRFELFVCKDCSDIHVYVDKDKMRHVIFNLIENAIKYTKEGFVNIKMSKYHNMLRIEISDSGVGISKDELSHLFDKFVRAKNVYGINVEGTGLGLYIAREIIHAHNGRIWAESEGVGKGATFIIELPISKGGKTN